MKTIENGVTTDTTTTTVTTADPATVPAAKYSDTVQQRLQELTSWQEQVPRFAIPPTPDATKRLTSAASVPPEFIELTNVALANQPALVRVEGATPAQIRDLVAYANAHDPLPDALEALAHFLRYSVTAARYAAGTEALTTYALAQRMAKLPQYAHLKPYVADMRRALGRGRKVAPEVAAQRAAQRAAKAAEKVAKKAAKLLAARPAVNDTTQQPS